MVTLVQDCDGCTLERHNPRGFVPGLLLTADMPFLSLLHSLMVPGHQLTLLGRFLQMSIKVYFYVIMLFRRIDDFIISDNDFIEFQN